MSQLTPVDQLQFALPGILPAKIGCGVDLALTEAEAFQYVEEGQHLARAVVARRNEFICGRRCARAALAQVGQAACALPTDANGLITRQRFSVEEVIKFPNPHHEKPPFCAFLLL